MIKESITWTNGISDRLAGLLILYNTHLLNEVDLVKRSNHCFKSILF